MAKVVKAVTTGAKRKSSFDSKSKGFIHHPAESGRVNPPDLRLVEELLNTRSRDLRQTLESIQVLEIDGSHPKPPAIEAMQDNPQALKSFLRVVKAIMTKDPNRLPTFRSLYDNASRLPDEVFNELAPSLVNTLGHYENVSPAELIALKEHPEALRPFLNLKSMFAWRRSHRFSELVENAAQLPEQLFQEMTPQLLSRLGKYSSELPPRTRRALRSQPEQLRPYLQLRQELALTGHMPHLPELAALILDRFDEQQFKDHTPVVKTLLSGCRKKELSDKILGFVEKYRPDQLRKYLQTQARNK
jgi:hypothetical protein